MGYAFQFVTLAGFHALNRACSSSRAGYAADGMAAYSTLQDARVRAARLRRLRAVKHQAFVGTGYFDEIARCVSQGESSTTALKDSTESRPVLSTSPSAKDARGSS